MSNPVVVARSTVPERWTRVVASAGAAVGACVLAAGFALDDRGVTADAGSFALVLPVIGLIAVGTLIVVRRGRNIVGWLCWLAGLLASLAFASGSYTAYGLTDPGSLPWVVAVGWFSLWLGSPWVWVLLSIPLVFPDGRLPSSRWRPAVRLVAIVMISECVVRALNPTVDQLQVMPYNPLGIEGAERLFAILERLTTIGIAIPVTAAVAALAVRFRRSAGNERLQLKWLLYAMSVVALLFALLAVAPDALSVNVLDVVFGLGYGLIPIAIAVAVLRYRLYDIDRLIRRTVTYITLTVLLASVYASGVLIAGRLFSGEQQSDFVVAASTLAAAALFRPIRHRTQLAVDRRFNRQRFDAARTVAAFSDAVREELDADALIRELLHITHEVVQPRLLSLWLAATPAAARTRTANRNVTTSSIRTQHDESVQARAGADITVVTGAETRR